MWRLSPNAARASTLLPMAKVYGLLVATVIGLTLFLPSRWTVRPGIGRMRLGIIPHKYRRRQERDAFNRGKQKLSVHGF